jgi:DNA-binding transcriptional ArsR family regulator
MVELLDNTFHALADPTRRSIVSTLMENGSCSIKELARPFSMSLSAVSKHIQVLERAKLVSRRKTGRENILTVNPEPMREMQKWLSFYETYWTDKFDTLEAVLEAESVSSSGNENIKVTKKLKKKVKKGIG